MLLFVLCCGQIPFVRFFFALLITRCLRNSLALFLRDSRSFVVKYGLLGVFQSIVCRVSGFCIVVFTVSLDDLSDVARSSVVHYGLRHAVRCLVA